MKNIFLVSRDVDTRWMYQNTNASNHPVLQSLEEANQEAQEVKKWLKRDVKNNLSYLRGTVLGGKDSTEKYTFTKDYLDASDPSTNDAKEDNSNKTLNQQDFQSQTSLFSETVSDGTYVAPEGLPDLKQITYLYGKLDATNATDYAQKLVNAIKSDIRLLNGKKKGKENAKLGFFSGLTSKPDQRVHRLETLFPEYVAKKKYVELERKVAELFSGSNATNVREELWKNIESPSAAKLDELADSIPNDEYDEDSKASEAATKYLKAVENGCKLTFSEWDALQPRSGIEKMSRSVGKIFKLLKNVFKSIGKKTLNALGIDSFDSWFDDEEEKNDKANNPEIKKITEAAEKENNESEWFKPENQELRENFNDFREKYSDMFSILDGKREISNTGGTTPEQISKDFGEVSVVDFKEWKEMTLFDEQTPITEILDHFKGNIGKPVGKEQWKKIVTHSKNIRFKNGKIQVRDSKDETFKDHTGSFELFSKKIESINETKEKDGKLVSEIEKLSSYGHRFEAEVRIPLKLRKGDKYKAFESFLKLDDSFWKNGNFKLNQRDIDVFALAVGGAQFDDGEKVFEETEETDEYMHFDGEALIEKENSEGKTVFEVNGSHGWDDYRFDSVEAFLEGLYANLSVNLYEGDEFWQNKTGNPRTLMNEKIKGNVKIHPKLLSDSKQMQSFVSLLSLPSSMWENYKLTKRDIDLFEKHVGGGSGEELFDNGETVFHDDDGNEFEVDGTGFPDEKFSTVQAFFEWLAGGGKEKKRGK
jgi:hypothetical protein